MMKRALLSFLFVFALSPHLALAVTGNITVSIPERYALLEITGNIPDVPLDKDTILSQMEEVFAKLDVEQFQFVLYDEGKKPEDGARAFGEIKKGKNNDAVPFLELTGEKAQLRGKLVTTSLGYRISPKNLYAAYSDNEVVADDDFKGKTIIMYITVQQVSKDPLGKPYINVGVGKTGLHGVQIYVDTKDPYLRKIKKGSKITIKGQARGFVMQSVLVDGVIIADEETALIDGKRVPLSEFSLTE
ncbi:OB-fold putative lipoprotein [Desulfovibrio sp. OttesenSCG-928-A18]|nr:OB-fold putative lipoprotein [Desulfovibrio sp. OttesenSCG-928-A18]